MDKELDTAIRSTTIGAIRLLSILFLSVGFLGLGMLKLVAQPEIVDHFNTWNIPIAIMYAIGVIELLLAVGIFFKPSRRNCALTIIIFMAGVTMFHIIKGDYTYIIGPSVIILVSFVLFLIESKSLSIR